MLSNEALSKLIRMKKKKVMEATPELVDTDARPDMTPQDVWDIEKKGYVEDMVGSPKKIDADETSMDAPDDDEIQMMDKARMGRLRAYIGTLDI